MARPLGYVRQFHSPSGDNPPLLICPHAGSGASTYRAFSKVLTEHFDVVVFQYPGRQDRAREAPAESLPELASNAFAEFAASRHNTGAPVSIFGHSMGAIVGFELGRRAEAAHVPVSTLAVSAAVSPGRVADLPPHPSHDDEILAHLAALEGTGDAVLANQNLMRMALPAMKADYRAFDAYACDPDVTVSARIVAMGGADDEIVSPGDLHGWRAHSTHPDASVTIFDGGHFYLNDNVAGVADLLVSTGTGVA